MKIDFNGIAPKKLEAFKGGALHMDCRDYSDDNVKIMSNTLVPGASIGLHTHADSCEVIFITSGVATAICDGATEALSAGDCHYCPKGSEHTLINSGTEPLEFLAVVPKM